MISYRPNRRLALPFLLLGSLPGCESTISSADLPEWGLERELTIGSLDNSEQALTYVTGMAVDGVGNIYVAQPMDQCIKVFSPNGELVRQIGRRGEGPGEFSLVGEFGWIGDTLYVSDSQNLRISYFGSDGSFLRSTSIMWPVIEDVFSPRGVSRVLPDGSVLVQPSFNPQAIADGTVSARPLFRMDTTGSVVRKVAETAVGNSQLSIQRGDSPIYASQVFSDAPLLGISREGDYVLVLHRDVDVQDSEPVMRLEKITAGGDTSFVREIPFDPVPLPQTAVDSILGALSEILSQSPMFETVREARQTLEDQVFLPEYYPPATRIVPTSGGEIWIQREAVGGALRRWDILSSSGVPIGSVMLAASAFVFDSKDGRLWMTERDELDITYVVRHRIVNALAARE